MLFKLTEILESSIIVPPSPATPLVEKPRLPRSPRPSPLRVDTLPGQTVFNLNEVSCESSYSSPGTTPGANDPVFSLPALSSGSRHGGKHVRRNSKEGKSDSPYFFRDSETRARSSSRDSKLVPPLHLDPSMLVPQETVGSYKTSPGTVSSLTGKG